MVTSRVLPPAGYPLSLASFGRALRRRPDALILFQRALEARLGVHASLLVSSGRGALTLGLSALAAASSRRVVVVPAYTCYTVPASVVRAGLRVRVCDVDPDTLDLNPSALEKAVREDVLAVIAAGLYGLPSDVQSVVTLAHRAGCRVVDDAAQCFGGEINGKACGTQGDFGTTSFSKGKGLSTFEGGALLSGDAEILHQAAVALSRETASPYGTSSMVVRSLGLALFQRPALYGLIHRLPMLNLGQSVFDPQFEVGSMTTFQGMLGIEALGRANEVIEARRVRANRYRQLLQGLDGVTLPREHRGSKPAWTRFPLLAANGKRDEWLGRCDALGLGASASYPQALSRLPELVPYLADGPVSCPGAELVARSVLTLPTHPLVRPEDQERITHALQ